MMAIRIVERFYYIANLRKILLGGAIIAEKIVGNREKVVFLHSSGRAFVRRLRKIKNLENVKL